MPTVAGYRSTIQTRGAESRIAPPPNGAAASVDRDLSRQWASGNAAGQCDVVYDTAGTATSTPTVLDMSALPSMVGASARNMVRLHELTIENTGAAALVVGGGSTPVLPDALTIPVGGRHVLGFAASGADGLNVATNKLLSISCATSTTYRITIAGRTA